jgi:sulfite exporter TauE/SafE/plastocyanin domain-containing protein/copper chaperone CopZ
MASPARAQVSPARPQVPALELPADDDAAGALHRRALELREYRMGRGPRPAGVDAPPVRTKVTTAGTIAVTLPVKGMTCRSCEVRIAKYVGRLPDVERVSASAVKGEVTVECSAPVSTVSIERAIGKAGYEVGRTPWLETDPRIWATAGLGVLLVAAVAIVASVTGIGDLASGAGDISKGGLVVALLLGLAAGVSTCMALVGGLVLGLSAAFQAGRPAGTSTAAQLRPAAVFVAGRVAGYALFGAVLGAIGASITMPPQLTAVLMLGVAVVMVVLGTRLTGLSPRMAGWSPTLPMGLGRSLGLGGDQGVSAYSDGRAAALGAASFFLPCGFTQAIQIFALSTGSPVYAAALLGTFALGTAPGLLALAGLPLVVPSRAKPTLLRLVGVVVIGFALLNGSAGLRLSGLTFPDLVGIASAAPLPGTLGSDGVQRVTTNQHATGYSPENLVIYAGYPTVWTIESTTEATCAASLWAPDLGLRERLRLGPNTINLPALSPGKLRYSCAMGMYGGSITVVEGPADAVGGTPSAAPVAAADPTPAPAASAPAAAAAPSGSEDPITRPWSADATAAPAAEAPAPTAAATPAVQELRTFQDDSGYGPGDATITAGIPTTWHVDSRSQYGCSAYIVVPSLGIEVVLKPGDNVIDLPALPAGRLEYTCAMGMYYGLIAIEPAGGAG